MTAWPRVAACRARGDEIEVRQLVTAMRQAEPTRDIAELALSYRHDGVAGFDIAGPEGIRLRGSWSPFSCCGASATTPFMPVKLVAVSTSGRRCRCAEPTGSAMVSRSSRTFSRMRSAVTRSGTSRRTFSTSRSLEMCPSSNVQTGTAASIAEHPIHRLDRLGFRVTVNPDNRLMSATTLTRSSRCSPRHSTTRLRTYAGSESTPPKASSRPTASAKRWLRGSRRPDRAKSSLPEASALNWEQIWEQRVRLGFSA